MMIVSGFRGRDRQGGVCCLGLNIAEGMKCRDFLGTA